MIEVAHRVVFMAAVKVIAKAVALLDRLRNKITCFNLFFLIIYWNSTMSTYKELTVQIENLQKQAAHARQSEIANAIADIKEKMRDYGITMADLGLTGAKKASKAKEPVAAKYRDSVSGATWSGRGKPPRWIAGQDRDAFIIK